MPIHLSNRAGTTYASRRKQQQQDARLQVYEDPLSSSDESTAKETKASKALNKQKHVARLAFGVKDANASPLPRVRAEHQLVKEGAEEESETDRKGKKPLKDRAAKQDSIGKENVSPVKAETLSTERKQARRGASSETKTSAATRPVIKNKQTTRLLAESSAEPWTPTTKRTRRPRREAASRGIDYCELDSPLPAKQRKQLDQEEERLSFTLEKLKIDAEETESESDASIEEHSEVSLVAPSPRHSTRPSRPGPRRYGARSAVRRQVLADISVELNDAENESQPTTSTNSYAQLLAACGQKKAKAFERCIAELLSEPLEGDERTSSSDVPANTVIKIGEASFSEVYRILPEGDVSRGVVRASKAHASKVLKVIPKVVPKLSPSSFLSGSKIGS